MSKVVWQACVVVVAGLGLTACVFDKKPETKALPNYQAPVAAIAPPANVAKICYDDADIGVVHARMVQQEVVVGALQCKTPDGKLALADKYGDFIGKYGNELSSNSASLTELAKRHHANVDVMVTAIANLTANQVAKDGAFCSRHQQALEWAMQPQVTSLSQIPSPYNLDTEINVFPCTHEAAVTGRPPLKNGK